MSETMQLEREYWQYQADRGVGNPLWECWEWKTMKGDHYWYSGYSRTLYQIDGNYSSIIIEEITQYWFPEQVGYRPLFVGLVFLGDEEYGPKKIVNTERVVSYTSIDWPMIRSEDAEDGDLKIWRTLKDGEWVTETIAK